MKVHLHYKTTAAPWGGTNSFARALARDLAERGVALTRRRTPSDVFLINGPYRAPGRPVDTRMIGSLKESGRPWRWAARLLGPAARRPLLVLRLDGLRADYAGEPSATDAVQLELARLADHVVFQSRYSRDVFAKAGCSAASHTVIPNGVDGRTFHPGTRRPWDGSRPLRLLASSWSENPAKGHASVAAFAGLSGADLRFVGRWPKSVARGAVRVEPPLAHSDLAETYRWADAFLFPARREACPNAALEALASGLPLLYHPEGGTAEIAAPYGVELTGDPAADLARLKAEYPALAEKVRRDRASFTISRAGADYLALFKRLCAGR